MGALQIWSLQKWDAPESMPGKTTFNVFLPITWTQETIMSKQIILCVDDEIIILEILGRQLHKAFKDRFIYEFAESAEEALGIIEEIYNNNLDIAVVISDWLMPGLRGDDFLIAVHQKFPHIIKIILTGQADETAIERARQQANLHSCLYKPWKSDELIETIKLGLAKLWDILPAT